MRIKTLIFELILIWWSLLFCQNIYAFENFSPYSSSPTVLPSAVTPLAHADTHEDGGSDEVTLENLPTASGNTNKMLKSDGDSTVSYDNTFRIDWTVLADILLYFGPESMEYNTANDTMIFRRSGVTEIITFDLANNSIEVAAVALPEVGLYDSGYSGVTRGGQLAAAFGGNLTNTGIGTQVSDVWLFGMLGGVKREILDWDGSAQTMTFGSPNDGEDFELDLSGTDPNVITEQSNSGVTLIESTTERALMIQTRISGTTYTATVQDCKGGTIYVTDAVTINLPPLFDGFNLTVNVYGAVTAHVNPDDSDLFILDGVALADGDKATSTGSTGAIIHIKYYNTDSLWASSDGWTDGN